MNALAQAGIVLAFFAMLAPGCRVPDAGRVVKPGPESPSDRRRPVKGPFQTTPMDAGTRDLLESKTVSLAFADAPLDKVIRSLRQQSGVEIIVDPAVYSMKTEDELRLRIEGRDIPLGEALRRSVSSKGLSLSTDLGVLLISDVQAQPGLEWRAVDVRDLLVGLDVRPVDIRLRSAQADAMPPMIESDEESDLFTATELVSLVRDNIPCGDWDGPSNRIGYRQGRLIIRNRPAVLEQALALLKRLREKR